MKPPTKDKIHIGWKKFDDGTIVDLYCNIRNHHLVDHERVVRPRSSDTPENSEAANKDE